MVALRAVSAVLQLPPWRLSDSPRRPALSVGPSCSVMRFYRELCANRERGIFELRASPRLMRSSFPINARRVTSFGCSAVARLGMTRAFTG